jgi:hypothetical protein
VLSVKEKPTKIGVAADIVKEKALQRLVLKTWIDDIGSINLVKKFEVITCRR